MNNYPQAFENKTEALAMKADLNQQSDELTELISKLLRPASTIHRPKQDGQQKLLTVVQEYIGMGILLATHNKNMPLLDILKVYKSKVQYVSSYRLYEIAVHVAEELGKHITLGEEFGLTTERLSGFNEMITGFGETLENTGVLLTDRKSGRNDLNTKVVACSKVIRLKIDPFMIFNEQEFPDLFKDYMLVRGSRKRKKRTAKTDITTGDISGVVTDSVTGLPLANATINILEQETAYTTDADGYYLIDELDASTYNLGCYAIGYNVPQQVVSQLTAGESLIIDFSLVPVNPINN